MAVNHQTFNKFLADWSKTNIKAWCDNNTIFSRGVGYYEGGQVEEMYVKSPSRAEFDVVGSDYYKVTLWIEDGHLEGECDCPSDYQPCKHQVAAVFELLNNLKAFPTEKEIDAVEEAFIKYLNGLTKEKIIELFNSNVDFEFKKDYLKLNAPPKTILVKKDELPKTDAKIDEVSKSIRVFLKQIGKQIEYFHELERPLVAQLGKLEPFYTDQPQKVADILIEVVEKLMYAIGNGELFGDDNEDIGNYSQIIRIFSDFAKSLSTVERLTFLNRLHEANDFGAFDDLTAHFENQFKGENDALILLRVYLQNPVKFVCWKTDALYFFFERHFTDDEKRKFLETNTLPESLHKPLIHFYQKLGDNEAILNYFQKPQGLNGRNYAFKIEYLNEFIDAAEKQKRNVNQTMFDCLRICPWAETLMFVIDRFKPDAIALPKLENYLESLSINSFFQYLVKAKRFAEAYELIKSRKVDLYPGHLYDFFMKAVEVLPEPAYEFALENLRKNEKEAAPRAYEAVGKYMELLKRADSAAFETWLTYLRLEYKRRSSLMNILDAKFGKAKPGR